MEWWSDEKNLQSFFTFLHLFLQLLLLVPSLKCELSSQDKKYLSTTNFCTIIVLPLFKDVEINEWSKIWFSSHEKRNISETRCCKLRSKFNFLALACESVQLHFTAFKMWLLSRIKMHQIVPDIHRLATLVPHINNNMWIRLKAFSKHGPMVGYRCVGLGEHSLYEKEREIRWAWCLLKLKHALEALVRKILRKKVLSFFCEFFEMLKTSNGILSLSHLHSMSLCLAGNHEGERLAWLHPV